MKVKWDENVCVHAGKCVSGLPTVFKVIDGKFVVDESGASEQSIRDQVAECPSGALTVEE
ncbi:MAG: (4Fe-4S)-binding protein [Gammaproteobacteria bacterium]|nr:(4Fe-4S)-binding protein [Gammaproteobacteria bacterium]MDD9868396.1 (4Fe-4S)-binding protein [Gammaproteobacteria bacterium]MDD9885676.1 (4Fe-4S)-binding protein [Gammaproteobacteria bacterium]